MPEKPTLVIVDVQKAFDDPAWEGPDGDSFPADLMHRTALASLHDESADVVSTDEAIARLG